ncbi:MAG: cyclic nucleotide-binding domain-containing protein [Acidimicrobiales bacterium]
MAAGARRAAGELPTLGGAWRSFWAGRAWDDRHRRLAGLPPFAQWSRNELRQLVARGDEVVVHAGDEILAEDAIGYWFVVVVDGALGVSRASRRVGTLRPGANVGEVAILGFGPQPATVSAATDARLFITGRRELISLADRHAAMRQLLFPDVDAADFRDHLRALRAEGASAWRRLPRREGVTPRPLPAGLRPPRPGRPSSNPGSFSRLAAAAFGRTNTSERSPGTRPIRHMSRRGLVAVAACTLIALIGAGLTYHPPVVVVSVADPIDVTNDVTVAGKVGPLNGRYLLTAVDLRQPHAIGAAWASTRGHTLLPLQRSVGSESLASTGHAVFVGSQHTATLAAAAAVGVDERQLTAFGVEINDRDLQGPSAALVYALAVADLLSAEDFARGRTVAATGTLRADGTIGEVAFSAEKVDAARRGGASLFLVPAGQTWPSNYRGLRVVPVRSLADALEALRAS